MRKIQKKTFADLIKENKEELLADTAAMKALEERLELKWIEYDKMGK
ncbi:FbpB family small basic protein [Domibacillus mangrovi]|uniref:Fur-regulated basic protein B n=1 Tax=Domibacillus mangrovi TaxID=1714354 RepID=A0A1Q5P3H8_9BACI|nr:FbpB family small basic protein [Domibacillus mangrovi]OKL36797.1 hypothetical protein BLL40_08685 [Domibacillus mangrovi]